LKDILLSDTEIIAIIKPLLWDTKLPASEYLKILKKTKNQRTLLEQKLANDIYIKIINFNYWRNIRQMFSIKRLRAEVLDDKVIQGLFPRQLRKDYEYVRRILQ
jgi:hypothetical protein